MPVKAARVNVTATATRLDNISSVDPSEGGSVTVKNLGTASVFIGGPDVTATTGREILPGEEFGFDQEFFWNPFAAITASGTVQVQVFEVRE